MKTFIRWQGNKRQHINKFKDWIPEFSGTYIEPFLGSGALFLYLQPQKWIINDLNKDLINIWKTVKDHPDTIINKFKKFGKKFIEMNKEEKTKWCRKLTSEIEDMKFDSKRAIVYLLMLYCGYSSSLIINNKFYFTSLSIDIINNDYSFLTDKYIANLLEINKYLNTKGKIYNWSYEKVLEKAKSGDFVFLDPPYIENHDYSFKYNKEEVLNDTFLENLVKECKKLDIKEVKWLMTQSDTKEVRKLFKEYRIRSFKVFRHFRKKYVKELVITNY